MPALKPNKPKPVSEVSNKTTFTQTGSPMKKAEKLEGGAGDNRPDSDFDPEQLNAGIKVELEHTKDRAVAKEVAKDHLTESADYYKKLKVMESDMDATKSLVEITKALKAMAVLGLSRRARMNAAYKVGVAAGTKAPEGPFATQDLSKEKLNIGITKEQLRPSYEPPVVPVRRVETPGQIAPKPCGDHEYKTAPAGPEEAKPLSERER
jgi:hypothetical protein